MRIYHFLVILMITIATLIVAVHPGTADSQETSAPTPAATPTPTTNPEKKKIVKVEQFRFIARHIYKADFDLNSGCFSALPEITKGKRRLIRMKSKAKGPVALRIMLKITKQERAEWRLYRYGDRITPYGCYAIPNNIVYCESKYDKDAYNSGSGALGWYQMLNKPVPWPINDAYDAIDHHEYAAYLYADSPSHWSQCL